MFLASSRWGGFPIGSRIFASPYALNLLLSNLDASCVIYSRPTLSVAYITATMALTNSTSISHVIIVFHPPPMLKWVDSHHWPSTTIDMVKVYK